MAYTNDDLVNINKEIAAGTTKVRYQDKEVMSRPLDELLRIKAEIEADINSNSTPPARRFTYVIDGDI